MLSYLTPDTYVNVYKSLRLVLGIKFSSQDRNGLQVDKNLTYIFQVVTLLNLIIHGHSRAKPNLDKMPQRA